VVCNNHKNMEYPLIPTSTVPYDEYHAMDFDGPNVGFPPHMYVRTLHLELYLVPGTHTCKGTRYCKSHRSMQIACCTDTDVLVLCIMSPCVLLVDYCKVSTGSR
jgi:hypothetical protein